MPDPVKPVPMPGVGPAHPTAGPAHPTAEPARPGEKPEELNVTVPGGKYAVPGTTDKFINAAGEPIDEKGKKIEDK